MTRLSVPIQGELNEADVKKIIDALKNVPNGLAGLNSAGQIGLSQIPLLPASQLGFGFAWELVGSIETSTAAASISFTNLSGDADKIYYLVLAISNASTTATGGIYIRVNGDTSVGNYSWISWRNVDAAVGTSTQGFGATSGVAGIMFGSEAADKVVLLSGVILAEGITKGTQTFVLGASYGFSINAIYYLHGGAWLKSGEVTELEVFTASGVAVNWKAYLFKPKW